MAKQKRGFYIRLNSDNEPPMTLVSKQAFDTWLKVREGELVRTPFGTREQVKSVEKNVSGNPNILFIEVY